MIAYGLDFGALLPWGLTVLAGVGIYYVRSSVEAAAAAKVAKAMETIVCKVEAQATLLMTKLDGLKDAIGSMTGTMRITEERHAVLAADVVAHSKLISEMRDYAHDARHEFSNLITRHELRIETLERKTSHH